jgi:hypothetical protein
MSSPKKIININVMWMFLHVIDKGKGKAIPSQALRVP